MNEYRKTFTGGFFFKNLRGAPKPRIEETPFPARVIIPLKQGFGSEVSPIVNPTDKVTAGQIIGISDSAVSTPVHSSVNGTVEQIIQYPSNGGGIKGGDVNAVVIEPDGSREWTRIEGASPAFERKNPDEIGKILYIAGVTSLGQSGFPTKYNTSSAQPENITDLIINAVNTEPFLPTNEILLTGNVEKFVTGIRVLRQALPEANVHIGINRQDKEIIKEIVNAAKDIDWLSIHLLKPKYPQEHEVVLTSTILGMVVPYGGHAADIGVIVLDVQAALHAYEAVVEGKPLIERIVTLGGPAYKDNIAAKVRVGTPIEHILAGRIEEGVEKRIILGGIMTGHPLEYLSIPMCRTTSSILALKEDKKREFLTFIRPGVNRHSFSYTFLSAIFPSWTKRTDTNMHGELRPCVACTFCTDACPVDLMPHLLSKYVEFGPLEETLKLKIHACIDCGLCTYVCPAKIPLMTDIQEGRKRIIEEAEEEEKEGEVSV
jgi:RnfABCDGE-type electron transport complex C subunit